MLVAQQLAAQRGISPLFAGVGFTLQPGEALHVTGANGSGKTTLLRMVCGLTRPVQGTLTWRGDAAPAALRESTLYVGHANALKDDLTAEQNLQSLSALQGGRRRHSRGTQGIVGMEPRRAARAVPRERFRRASAGALPWRACA
jgi:heme exporter protein A